MFYRLFLILFALMYLQLSFAADDLEKYMPEVIEVAKDKSLRAFLRQHQLERFHDTIFEAGLSNIIALRGVEISDLEHLDIPLEDAKQIVRTVREAFESGQSYRSPVYGHVFVEKGARRIIHLTDTSSEALPQNGISNALICVKGDFKPWGPQRRDSFSHQGTLLPASKFDDATIVQFTDNSDSTITSATDYVLGRLKKSQAAKKFVPVIGFVGEGGSGKSTIAKLMINADDKIYDYAPAAGASKDIAFFRADLLNFPDAILLDSEGLSSNEFSSRLLITNKMIPAIMYASAQIIVFVSTFAPNTPWVVDALIEMGENGKKLKKNARPNLLYIKNRCSKDEFEDSANSNQSFESFFEISADDDNKSKLDILRSLYRDIQFKKIVELPNAFCDQTIGHIHNLLDAQLTGLAKDSPQQSLRDWAEALESMTNALNLVDARRLEIIVPRQVSAKPCRFLCSIF